MASHSSFLTLEFSLARRLTLDWYQRTASKIQVQALAEARAGDFSSAKRTVGHLTFAPTVEANTGFIDQIALKAYLLGQSFFTEGRVADGELAKGNETEPVGIALAPASMLTGLEQSVERVRRAAWDVLDEAEREESQRGLIFKAANLSLAVKLNKAVANGTAVIETSANLTTSRLASYGALVQADALGSLTYQISEALDKKTCAVCRRMHGLTFNVGEALEAAGQTLLTVNPQEIAAASPWPSSSRGGISELTGLSESELVARGLNRPPFHAVCRGILVPDGTIPSSSILGMVPFAAGLTLDEAAAVELAQLAG